MPEHKARQYSDQLHCHICGKQWDVNDPEPPECINEETPYTPRVTKKGAKKRQVRRRIEELREQLRLGRDD